MPPFLLNLLLNKYAWMALAFALLAAYGAYWRHDAKATQEAFETYRTQVIADGIAAAAKAKETERRQTEATKGVKDALAKSLANLDAANKRLRDARTRGGILPRSADPSAPAPVRACADWSQLEHALSDFVGETSGLAEEGDRAALIRDAWREWWSKVQR